MTSPLLMWLWLLDSLGRWALPPGTIARAYAHSPGVVAVGW